MNHYDGNNIINIGSGEDLAIAELVILIKNIIGYTGEIVWNSLQPDGTPRKLLDISQLKAMGWFPRISLVEGLKDTIAWCKDNDFL